ncbi:D-aminopeptidase [compost metagenome]
MMPLYPVAEDVLIMSCRRSMDAPAPGDWTIQVRRDASGAVSGFTLGCWLARKIEYIRTA